MVALAPASAQVSEAGLTGGLSYYIGDINPLRHYPRHMHMAGGLFYRYNITPHYAVRFQGLYTRLEAYDSDSPDPVQQTRNLGFRSNIFELAFTVEVNFLKYRSIDRKNNHLWTPYLFVGLGYFHMNPQNRLDDTWYDLQPLGTEGQGTASGGKPYPLDVFNIPHGFGFKFAQVHPVGQREFETEAVPPRCLQHPARLRFQIRAVRQGGPGRGMGLAPHVHRPLG